MHQVLVEAIPNAQCFVLGTKLQPALAELATALTARACQNMCQRTTGCYLGCALKRCLYKVVQIMNLRGSTDGFGVEPTECGCSVCLTCPPVLSFISCNLTERMERWTAATEVCSSRTSRRVSSAVSMPEMPSLSFSNPPLLGQGNARVFLRSMSLRQTRWR